MSDTTHEQLKNKVIQLSNDLFSLEQEYNKRKTVLMQEVQKVLDNEFAQKLIQASSEKQQAVKELNDLENKLRLQEVKLPYPENTILCHWLLDWDNQYKILKSDGKYVMQIFRENDAVSLNIKYDKPNVGDIILRQVNKNGKFGKKVFIWEDWMKTHYFPENVNPNELKNNP